MTPIIDEIIKKRRILITCGTGGVGKTTISAALAVRAALLGKKTLVITIDPAKRLATSLGLLHLGDQPTDLTETVKAAYQKAKNSGQKIPAEFKGSLAAIIPDTQKTFENFVLELAPDRKMAERVMQNPIFQIFSKEFSGTNEYMALERLLALSNSSSYDCIILDTPPSRNTLAFLNAPKLLSQFFEERLIRWLVLPANRLVASGMKKVLSTLERMTGAGFMTHLFEFASALFSVQVNFTQNLKEITALLESSQVGFLMVTTPLPESVPEINHFIASLQAHRYYFDGIVLNRTLDSLKIYPVKSDFQEAIHLIEALQARERRVIQNLLKNPDSVCAKIPELARDVHSLEDLFHVAMAFGANDTFNGTSVESLIRSPSGFGSHLP